MSRQPTPELEMRVLFAGELEGKEERRKRKNGSLVVVCTFDIKPDKSKIYISWSHYHCLIPLSLHQLLLSSEIVSFNLFSFTAKVDLLS